MKKKIFLILLSIVLLFTDINKIAIPYLGLVMVYMYYKFYNKQYNEIVLALTFFGYSFFILLNKVTGLPNIGLIFAMLLAVFLIRLMTGWEPAKKLKLAIFPYNLMLYAFFGLILFAMTKTELGDYQVFKIQLWITWAAILFASLHCYDDHINHFNFEEFLIISFYLFVPQFTLAADDGGVSLSPIQTWRTYSVLDDGIRGHEYDIITATRIAGIGMLAFLCHLLDFSVKKIYLFFLMSFFVIVMIICQTRQSLAAIIIPILILLYFNFFKQQKSNFNTFIGIVLVLASVTYYLNYLNANNVESRLVENADGDSEEGTGREEIYAAAKAYIAENPTNIGFGNYVSVVGGADYPHNIFLEIMLEEGYVAVLVLICIVGFIFIEVFKLIISPQSPGKLELFAILATLYFLGLAQFSVDIARNQTFFYTFALFLSLKNKRLKELALN
ncbi:O-antigen ligase family protein [Flavobacterium branchiophilum]|uniref:O-antigen ligase-related domain-containing protein n=2 Tax=Flavobacterium branchiophilum TaxID=55197 RepID=A0A2H3KVN7_9FLAO|nr:O-antigen ligase family protein [Flavobacterium branchiophilum]PDS24627.1 hypothetical protein B0A77_07570 [Flavobacterium branchiophilum]CCB68881.1 Hypothetical transmembrane protein [Flavobacterium branchiophilum FL-15]